MSLELSVALKTATQAQHQQLHRVVSLRELFLSREAYIKNLLTYWQFICPLELALLEHAVQIEQTTAELGICNFDLRLNLQHSDWQTRLVKRQWLAADLRELNKPACEPAGTTRVAGSPNRLAISDAQFVGCWYVIEGMTLGGQLLSRQLNDQLGIDESNGGRFFMGYGDLTRDRWQQWIHWANTTGVDIDAAVLAAQQTFDRFRMLLEQQPIADPVQTH